MNKIMNWISLFLDFFGVTQEKNDRINKKQLISKQLFYIKAKKKYTNSQGDCDKKNKKKKTSDAYWEL